MDAQNELSARRVSYEELPDGATMQTLAHLYRGESTRADAWRTRLDTTTNWAMTVTAAVSSLTFAPSSPTHVLLVALFLVYAFLVIETRRYRYHDLYIRRVRLLESGFLAPILRHEPPDSDALRELAEMLDRPVLRLSWLDAFSVRLGRTYGVLFALLIAQWFFRLTVHPRRISSIAELYERAHIGILPGTAVLLFMVAISLALVALLLRSRWWMATPRGEIAPARRRSLRNVFFARR